MFRKRNYPRDPYWTTGRFGICKKCGQSVKDKRIFYYPNDRAAYCETCGDQYSRDFASCKFDEMVYNS